MSDSIWWGVLNIIKPYYDNEVMYISKIDMYHVLWLGHMPHNYILSDNIFYIVFVFYFLKTYSNNK